MKKIVLIGLLSLIGLFAVAQAPHPALLFTPTGQSSPSFIALKNLNPAITSDDWVGCYDDVSMLCYGAFKAKSRNHYIGAYLDEEMTEKKDGYTYGAVIKLFYYKADTKQFFKISGTYINALNDAQITELKAYPMALYYVTNVVIDDEIQLAVDPELSEVVFNFISMEMPVITGESDAVKLKFIHKNTSEPTIIKALGSGTIEKRWDGYYYKYAAEDVNVIINAVGKNNFTGEMVTAKLALTLEQTAHANAIVEDENFVIYKKKGQVFLKVKAEKLSAYVYWNDKGTWRRLYLLRPKPQGFEIAFLRNYSNKGWGGIEGRIEYLHWANGKMVSKNRTVLPFTF